MIFNLVINVKLFERIKTLQARLLNKKYTIGTNPIEGNKI